MLSEWNRLPEALQMTLAAEALRQASTSIASQAESLAAEIEHGSLSDRGGPDALRLLAAVLRSTSGEDPPHLV